MFTFKQTTLALASAGVLSLAMSGAVQADVMASSMINMTNFKISYAGGAQLANSNFSALTFTSSADYSGSLGASSFSNSSSAAPINFPVMCAGPASGCAAFGAAYGPDNSFTKLFAPPVGNYAAADQAEAGAPITGLADFPSPASVANASYAGLNDGTALASSNSNNNLNSSFIFALGQGGALTFSFDVNAYLQAYITAAEKFPGFASSSYQFDFSIVNQATGATVFNYAPDLFGDGTKTLSLNAPPFAGTTQFVRDTGGIISFSATTAALTAGTPYQLSARIQTNADAQRVPEPGVLALLGLGLLGLGLSRRRKTV